MLLGVRVKSNKIFKHTTKTRNAKAPRKYSALKVVPNLAPICAPITPPIIINEAKTISTV